MRLIKEFENAFERLCYFPMSYPLINNDFVKDKKKSGGNYKEKTGIVRKIDMIEHYIQFIDKSKININDLLIIEGEIFNETEIE